MSKVAYFLPTRKGSQRVRNKNTRSFAGLEDGLIGLKLSQLVNMRNIDEIILSTNDEDCIRIAEKFAMVCDKIKIIIRPEELCLASTNLQDLIAYVPTITKAEHILWGHVTTPIANAELYDKAVDFYFSQLRKGYDSLVSVTTFRNFLLNNDGCLVNNKTSLLWPRTQDLETLYEINHVIFMASRDIYEHRHNRLGTTPYLFVMDKIQSLDIDWEDDFTIAEIVYRSIMVKQIKDNEK